MPLVCSKDPGITLDLAMWPLGLGGGAARENPGEVLAGEGREGEESGSGVTRLDLGAYLWWGEDRRVGTADAGGGSRWRRHSGELAAWLGQQVRGEATRSPRARWSNTCWRCKWPESGVHRGGSYGGELL
jgi:hypothetical protein